ncbi:MAG: hypothetical protein K6U80_00180 [Firmicutes bacterium]|nr:hypothetical protein [Bacillota bacterium]
MEGRCPEFGDEILGQRLAGDGLHFVAGAFTARLGAEDCGFVKPSREYRTDDASRRINPPATRWKGVALNLGMRY